MRAGDLARYEQSCELLHMKDESLSAKAFFSPKMGINESNSKSNPRPNSLINLAQIGQYYFVERQSNMALPVAQKMAQIQGGVSDDVVAEAEEKADEAVEAVDEAEEMMEEAGDLVATSAACSFSKSELADHAPCAENANINVKIIGASQEMCSYLPLLQKLPAALVIRKVNVTKHSSRVSLKKIFT